MSMFPEALKSEPGMVSVRLYRGVVPDEPGTTMHIKGSLTDIFTQ